MRRRDLIRTAGAATAKTLRFVPQADLSKLDPVVGTQLVVCDAGLLVCDTLYRTDSRGTALDTSGDTAWFGWPKSAEIPSLFGG